MTCNWRYSKSVHGQVPALMGDDMADEQLALLGAVLGSAVAFAAVLAWAPGSVVATLAPVPWLDVLLILAGLPVMAAVVGWLQR
jgi:hypothetical protein